MAAYSELGPDRLETGGGPVEASQQAQPAEKAPAAGPVARKPGRRWLSSGRSLQLLSVACFLLIWQIAGSRLNPILISTPLLVLKAFGVLLKNGELLDGFLIALGDLALGYVLAVSVGVIIGIWMGRSRTVEQVLNPYVNFMQSTPLIALVPLVVIWFGIGYSARVAVVFVLSVWSVIINTSTGIKTTNKTLVEVARVFHLPEARLVREIALPGAIPHIFAGLRVSLGKAVIGMMIAEMEIRLVGLGGLVMEYGEQFQTAYLLAGIITSSLVGVVTAILLDWIQNRFFPWIAATSGERN